MLIPYLEIRKKAIETRRLILTGMLFGLEDSGIWVVFNFSDASHPMHQRSSYDCDGWIRFCDK